MDGLGAALQWSRDPKGAAAEFREALRLDPRDALAHMNLATVMATQGDAGGAITELREAVRFDPTNAFAHDRLANLLVRKGELGAAAAELREAVRLEPKNPAAHNNLAWVLQQQGDLDGAVAEYREALRLDPSQPKAHINLPPAERMRELLHLLPELLAGRAEPKSPAEACEVALLCAQPYQKRYAASARLYADAFAAEPKLAADLDRQHRYNAACSAALAAAGQGQDSRRLPDKVVTMFRHWALDWLRDDLTGYAKLAGQTDPAVRQAIQQRLAHWRSDPDLAWVRDRQALDRLGEDERVAWRALWRDADGLSKRLGKKDVPLPR